MEDHTKNVVGGFALGAAAGAAGSSALAGVGIRQGFWEIIAPLVIFLCLVACAIAWGSASLAEERSDPCYGNMSDPVCVERIERDW